LNLADLEEDAGQAEAAARIAAAAASAEHEGPRVITGLCGPRAGRHGIWSVGSPYWRAPAPKPRSSRAPGSITSQRSAVVEAIPSLRLAPCAPPLRAVYPNLAIGALGCTRLRGWCRDRRLEFRFGRRATRGWRVWIDQGNSCNRHERRNRLRNPCRQGGLAILDQRSGDIRLQAGVGSAERAAAGYTDQKPNMPQRPIDNKMDADGCGHRYRGGVQSRRRSGSKPSSMSFAHPFYIPAILQPEAATL
jgi:hypothetical protein